jgi:tRNA A-37 threonylcarbamoyl transferase component Bud32
MNLAPGTMLGTTYQVVRRIGGGGMGDVYEVTHRRLAGRYAAKVLNADFASHPDAFSRFRREAMVTSGLRHPGIVQVIDFDRTDEGHSFLVMELLEGEELAAIIRRDAPLPLARALGLVEQIGSALHAAHRQGIVHRDLKPQNVFVLSLDRGRDLVKILDFGISKAQVATQRLTSESAMLGTPQYMAPEQAIGRSAEVDARADQFALAALTYELLSGRPPFSGDTVMALIYQIVHVDPPPLAAVAPALPAAVDAAIRRGLSKQPEDRFDGVGGLVAALFAAAGGEAPAAARPIAGGATRVHPAPSAPASDGARQISTTLSAGAAQTERAVRPPRRIAAASVLVAVAIAAVGAMLLWRGPRRAVDAGAPGGVATQRPPVVPVSAPNLPVTAPQPAAARPAPGPAPLAASPSPLPSPATDPTRSAPTVAGAATAAPTSAAPAAGAATPPRMTVEPAKRDTRRKRSPAKADAARTPPARAPRDELVDDL